MIPLPSRILCAATIFAVIIIFHLRNSIPSDLLESLPFASVPCRASMHQDTRHVVKKAPKIIQGSMLLGPANNTVFERAMQTHIEHGERWGCRTHILREGYKPRSGEGLSVWDKTIHMLSIIDQELSKPETERAEWLVYFDPATLLLNPHIPWSLFLPPPSHQSTHLLTTKPTPSHPISLLFLRINPWTTTLLTQTLALAPPEKDTQTPTTPTDAMAHLLSQPGFHEHTVYQPKRWYDSPHHPCAEADETRQEGVMMQFTHLSLEEQITAIRNRLETRERFSRPYGGGEGKAFESQVDLFWTKRTEARSIIGSLEALRTELGEEEWARVRRRGEFEGVSGELGRILGEADELTEIEKVMRMAHLLRVIAEESKVRVGLLEKAGMANARRADMAVEMEV